MALFQRLYVTKGYELKSSYDGMNHYIGKSSTGYLFQMGLALVDSASPLSSGDFAVTIIISDQLTGFGWLISLLGLLQGIIFNGRAMHCPE